MSHLTVLHTEDIVTPEEALVDDLGRVATALERIKWAFYFCALMLLSIMVSLTIAAV